MSCSDRLPRRVVLLGGLATLAACDLAPVYGPAGAGPLLQNRIRPDDPTTEAAHAFVARLEERLGRAPDPAYRLAYTLSTRTETAAASPTRSASRIRLIGTATLSVHDAATGAELASDRVEAFTAYSTTDTPLATRAAAEDAERRLMAMLADQAAMRLLATATRWAALPGR